MLLPPLSRSGIQECQQTIVATCYRAINRHDDLCCGATFDVSNSVAARQVTAYDHFIISEQRLTRASVVGDNFLSPQSNPEQSVQANRCRDALHPMESLNDRDGSQQCHFPRAMTIDTVSCNRESANL
jgi:hypothetical protein